MAEESPLLMRSNRVRPSGVVEPQLRRSRVPRLEERSPVSRGSKTLKARLTNRAPSPLRISEGLVDIELWEAAGSLAGWGLYGSLDGKFKLVVVLINASD